MQIDINHQSHELYLDLHRFVALEKENPKLLGEIIQKRLNIGLKELYQQHKAKGQSVTYRHPDYPGEIIREEADGRRFIVRLDLSQGYREEVVREIPPRSVKRV